MADRSIICHFIDQSSDSNIGKNTKYLLRARFIKQSDENCPNNAWHIYVETEPAVKRNQDVLNYLPGESYLIKTDGKKNSNYSVTQLKLFLIY